MPAAAVGAEGAKTEGGGLIGLDGLSACSGLRVTPPCWGCAGLAVITTTVVPFAVTVVVGPTAAKAPSSKALLPLPPADKVLPLLAPLPVSLLWFIRLALLRRTMKNAATPTRARMTTTAAMMPGTIDEDEEEEDEPPFGEGAGLVLPASTTGASLKEASAAEVATPASIALTCALLTASPKESSATTDADDEEEAAPRRRPDGPLLPPRAASQGISRASTFGGEGIARMAWRTAVKLKVFVPGTRRLLPLKMQD